MKSNLDACPALRGVNVNGPRDRANHRDTESAEKEENAIFEEDKETCSPSLARGVGSRDTESTEKEEDDLSADDADFRRFFPLFSKIFISA